MTSASITQRRFDGRVAAVTGAASGIGRATALRLAAEGAHVVVIDRAAEDAERTTTAIRTSGGSAETVVVDLGDDAAVSAAGTSLATRHARLHALANCAGVVHVDGSQENPFLERGLTGWDLVMGVNVRGLAGLVLAVAPALVAARGAVVNVSSEAAYRARAGRWIYDASKAAVVSVTRSMAAAFAPDGVRVVGVAPGGTITEMHLQDHADPEAARERMRHGANGNLLNRLAEPEEIAAAITFALSDDASFITGTTLAVDGGGAASR
ncbi:SDR family NAD(P)-dependent oxidoreductase [Agromyces silvae]|uniref:SDR family NAD(P)-dependent oxidoreductase n=1 Tax=Agromyces silvae TaxID=3388266 RepID=UPI00280AB25F|nr:SDR family oxidoreductase [Agromyces protaetiae]